MIEKTLPHVSCVGEYLFSNKKNRLRIYSDGLANHLCSLCDDKTSLPVFDLWLKFLLQVSLKGLYFFQALIKSSKDFLFGELLTYFDFRCLERSSPLPFRLVIKCNCIFAQNGLASRIVRVLYSAAWRNSRTACRTW